MQLTIAAWDDRVFPVELDANEPFATLMAILEAESGLPAAQQQLLHNGRPLPPSAQGQGLTALGIADGDMLMLMPLQQQGGAAGQGQQQRGGAGVCQVACWVVQQQVHP
jgi:DNA damage-inducible protein 1